MKRWTCALLLLIVALTCTTTASGEGLLRGYTHNDGYQYVALGSFPQTEQGDALPILWRVLEADDEQAYLLSEYILFNSRIHPDDKEFVAFGGAFAQTEVYRLLNGPFERIVLTEQEEARLRKKSYYGRVYDAEMGFLQEAFTDLEQSYMVVDEALGAIFLPTAADLNNKAYGFETDKQRRGYGTAFALAGGLFQYMNGSSPYWTRTPSVNYPYAGRCTKEKGNLGYIRCVVMNEGCRPALRLRLDGLTPTGGDGSMGNPYTFAR